jgi:uncharacterized protein (DUF2141 family)
MHRKSQFLLFAVVSSILVMWSMGPGSTQAKSASYGKLVVEVEGFRNSKGRARAGIFRSDSGFPLEVDDAKIKVEAPIQNNKATLTFSELPHGTYSVVVYHDEDADGSLDTNWMGMPKEGAGIHRPPSSRIPPPDFEDCKFSFDKARLEVKISLRYL